MPQGLPYTGPPPPPLKLNGDAEIPDVPNTKKDPRSRRWSSQAPAFIQKIVRIPQPSPTPSRTKQEDPINNLISSGMGSKVNSDGSEAIDPPDEKTVHVNSNIDATDFVRDTDWATWLKNTRNWDKNKVKLRHANKDEHEWLRKKPEPTTESHLPSIETEGEGGKTGTSRA